MSTPSKMQTTKLIQYEIFQPDFCKQCCVKLNREFRQDHRATLVEAASLHKEGKRQQAITLLLKSGGVLVLAAVQIMLAQVSVAI